MDFSLTEEQFRIRDAVREVCARFPGKYWRALEASGAYPREFVDTLTELGWLSILIPEEYGGGGLGITEACVVLEEIHRSGGNANCAHAQMYTMGALLRHGSAEQKRRYLPGIARGELRLQAFAVTEPDAGSDSTRIATRAVRDGDDYVIDGQKVFISRVEQSDLMILLARTGDRDAARGEGLSLFLVDLREAAAEQQGAIETRRIPLMFNHHTYQVFFSGLRVPAPNLIGELGRGFRQVIDGWNAERCLLASEAIGDGRFFTERASAYASQRSVFGKPVGANQGVQFPIAQAYAQLEAASLVRFQAAALFDAGQPCGKEANTAKLLASQASAAAGNAAMTAFGGNAFAAEYDIERKFRETKLLEIAPVSNNLVLAYLAQHTLGLPRSY
jgi:acyl-CoA dehydrogenase